MKQLTKEQAIIITGYTGIIAVKDFGTFHEEVEERLNRPVGTHQFPELKEEIKEAFKKDFLDMCYDESSQ